MQAGNSKFGVAQAGMGKIGMWCCDVQQPQHTAVNGRIWVLSGGLQTYWLAEQHLNCVYV